MLEAVIHRTEGRFNLKRTEDAADVFPAAVPLLQRCGELVDVPAQRPGIERIVGTGGGDLDENLVFQADIAKSELAFHTRSRQ